MPLNRRVGSAILIVLLAGLAALARPAVAAGADAGLVIAAVNVLERDYVKPVDVVALLNAATASLRKQTNLGTDTLRDIPSGTPQARAEGILRREFAKAAQVGNAKEDTLAYQATRNMLASLHDTHVFYMDPAAFKEYQSQLATRPSYAGIGAAISSVKDASGNAVIFLGSIFSESPAAAAGLQRFDRIMQVDNIPVAADATRFSVANEIRGPAGSTVTLAVQRRGQTLTVPIVRKAIEVVPVQGTTMLKPGIGYIQLIDFSKGSADQFRVAVKSLQAQGAIRGMIVDLRGNGGGYLNECEGIAGVFLHPQTLLAHVLRRQGPTQLIATGTPMLPQIPLVLLTGTGTASSAEVLTLALHDAHRATLAGEKTAGALGGASIVPLPAGGMSVTVEEVDGPRYEQVEGVGIVPDQEVPLTAQDVAQDSDTQLDAALQAVNAGK